MKVLLKKTVAKLGIIGDVVDVKPGYARNYLIPQRVATEPTEANLKNIEAEKQQYLEQLSKEQEHIQAKADTVRGKEITIMSRANEQGHLYGSIGPAQISAALAAEGVMVEPEYIILEEHIKRLDKYDLTIRFNQDVTATIHVWVVPDRDSDEQTQEEQVQEEQVQEEQPDETD